MGLSLSDHNKDSLITKILRLDPDNIHTLIKKLLKNHNHLLNKKNTIKKFKKSHLLGSINSHTIKYIIS